MQNKRNHNFIQVFLVGLVLASDQLTKRMFEVRVLNTGGVFGYGDGWWGIGAVSLILVMGLGWLWLREKNESVKIGLLMIFSAGFSNLIDRWGMGGVRDFIWWPVLNVYGNVADIWLAIGVGWIVGHEVKK